MMSSAVLYHYIIMMSSVLHHNDVIKLQLEENTSVSVEEVDEDVQAEEDALRVGFPEDAPIVMFQLRKEYPGTGGKPAHVAVHSVSLSVQRNECFGLLGPNGESLPLLGPNGESLPLVGNLMSRILFLRCW